MAKKYNSGKCSTPVCDEPAVVASMCKACYGSMRYWLQKTPAQVVERQEKLRKFDSRMSRISNTRYVHGKQRKRA